NGYFIGRTVAKPKRVITPDPDATLRVERLRMPKASEDSFDHGPARERDHRRFPTALVRAVAELEVGVVAPGPQPAGRVQPVRRLAARRHGSDVAQAEVHRLAVLLCFEQRPRPTHADLAAVVVTPGPHLAGAVEREDVPEPGGDLRHVL